MVQYEFPGFSLNIYNQIQATGKEVNDLSFKKMHAPLSFVIS